MEVVIVVDVDLYVVDIGVRAGEHHRIVIVYIDIVEQQRGTFHAVDCPDMRLKRHTHGGEPFYRVLYKSHPVAVV